MKKIYPLVFMLLCGCAAVKTAPTRVFQAHLDIKERGLATAHVEDRTGRTIRTLFDDKAVVNGGHGLSWDGMAEDGKEAPVGNYRLVMTVNRWKPVFMGRFGGLGSSQGRFVHPGGIGAAFQGSRLTVAVADTGNNRVQLLTETGTFLQEIGQFGLGGQKLNQPTDVDWDGHILTVCDSQNRRLARFDSVGSYLGEVRQLSGFQTSPSSPVRLDFQGPTHLRREGGSFWVSDPGYGLLDLITNTGGLIQQLGRDRPLGNEGPFAHWADGGFWIKAGKDSVRKFDANGNDSGAVEGDPAFHSVGGFGVSPEGFALVTDPDGSLVYFFDPQGACFGALPLENCRRPGTLAILEEHLFVIDQDQSAVFYYKLSPAPPAEYRQALTLLNAASQVP